MSRDFSQHSLITQDLFDRENAGLGGTCSSDAAIPDKSVECPQSAFLQPELQLRQSRRTTISEELWEDARRRHRDSRQNWRSLLDRFVKPHH